MKGRLLKTMAGLAALVLAGAAQAGPLDRASTGPRDNPAANSMLRVPGALGQDCNSALATVQAAGLNPMVRYIKEKDDRYEGREGLIVAQVPSAGGMAMIGSSVSLTCYRGEPAAGSPTIAAPVAAGAAPAQAQPADPAPSAAVPSQPPATSTSGNGSVSTGNGQAAQGATASPKEEPVIPTWGKKKPKRTAEGPAKLDKKSGPATAKGDDAGSEKDDPDKGRDTLAPADVDRLKGSKDEKAGSAKGSGPAPGGKGVGSEGTEGGEEAGDREEGLEELDDEDDAGDGALVRPETPGSPVPVLKEIDPVKGGPAVEPRVFPARVLEKPTGRK